MVTERTHGRGCGRTNLPRCSWQALTNKKAQRVAGRFCFEPAGGEKGNPESQARTHAPAKLAPRPARFFMCQGQVWRLAHGLLLLRRAELARLCLKLWLGHQPEAGLAPGPANADIQQGV